MSSSSQPSETNEMRISNIAAQVQKNDDMINSLIKYFSTISTESSSSSSSSGLDDKVVYLRIIDKLNDDIKVLQKKYDSVVAERDAYKDMILGYDN